MNKELEALERTRKKLAKHYDIQNIYEWSNIEDDLDIIETALKDYDLLKRSLNRNWVDVVNDDKKLKALEIIKDYFIFSDDPYDKALTPKKPMEKEKIDLLKEVLV